MSLLGSEQAALPAPGPASEPTDGSLLRRLRGGNEDAAALLYARYAQRLQALARARCSPHLARCLEAEDIVQSVFRRFFQRAQGGYYAVPDGEALWGLLLVIALNKIRAEEAFYRAARRDVRATRGGEGLDQVAGAVGRDGSAEAFWHLAIEDALASFPPRDRQAVELRLQGYKVAEIADQTRRSKRTVERVLQEAQKKLSDLFHEDP
jgi:RNA polymerase sigma-70 factor (ECF subfamily)